MSNFFNKIEAYLEGKLSAEQTKAFEEALTKNQKLAYKLELYRMEREAANLLRERDLKSKFAEWDEEMPFAETDTPKEKTTSIRRLYPFWIAAASLLLILSIGFAFYQSTQHSNAHLYAEAYQNPLISYQLKGGSSSTTALSIGLKLLEEKEWEKARTQLGELSRNSPAYFRAQLLISHTFMLENRISDQTIDEAQIAKSYQRIINEAEDATLINEAEWYLLLEQLRTNQVDEKFKAQIKKIAENPDHNFNASAKKLLRRLNSFWYN